MTEPDATTLVDALRSDHRSVTHQLADPATRTGDEDGLIAREQLVRTMVRHFVAEEQYLYPTVRTHLPESDAVGDALAADRECENLLRGFERKHLTADALGSMIDEVASAFAAHVERQEPLLSALDETLDPTMSAELGEQVIGAEQLAPTRPRRVVTESPGANKVLSFFEGYLDNIRDAYGHRGKGNPDDIG